MGNVISRTKLWGPKSEDCRFVSSQELVKTKQMLNAKIKELKDIEKENISKKSYEDAIEPAPVTEEDLEFFNGSAQ